MKHLFTLIIFIGFTASICNAQNDKLDDIINQFCSDISLEKIKKMSPEKMQTELLKIGSETREKYSTEVNQVLSELKKKNKGLSDVEVNALYGKELILRAIDICPEYRELALLPLGKCPKENKTLIMVHKEVQKVIAKNKDKTDKEKNDLIVKAMTTALFSNMEQVNKDYEEGIANPQLRNDMNAYLFHKSNDFLKIVLSSLMDI